MANPHINHPLDYGIEEIDLSKNYRYQNSARRSSNNIEEINVSSSKVQGELPPNFIKKNHCDTPDVPERPSRKNQQNEVTFNIQNDAHPFQARPKKRIAPRILPQIPINHSNYQTVFSAKLNDNESNTRPVSCFLSY